MMRAFLSMLLLVLPIAAQNPPAANRRDLLTKLMNDAVSARGNATLSDLQRKQLDGALEGLRIATGPRQKKVRRDKERTRQAVIDLQQMASAADLFRPEDRTKVQADLQALRDFQQKKREAAKAAKVN